MKIALEKPNGSQCNCANKLSPVTPDGPTVRLMIDGTQRGFYCMGCLPGMIEAIISVEVNAAVMKATTKVGDTVTWSGAAMTVLEVSDAAVRCEDLGMGFEWYSWGVINKPEPDYPRKAKL